MNTYRLGKREDDLNYKLATDDRVNLASSTLR